jgi:hypothetical protein
MTEIAQDYYLKRACAILENMALKNDRAWYEFWVPRWQIHDEPLRNDAANLLAEIAEYERQKARADQAARDRILGQ